MSKAGYNIIVFQTKHLNFCNNKYVTECYTLDSFNPFSKFIISDKNRFTRFKEYSYTIIKPFFSPTSKITRNSYILNYFFYLFHSYFDNVPMWVDGYAFPKWFDYIKNKISQYPDNTMVFAHLLVPHAPYILDYDCKYSGKPDFPYSLGENYNFQNREKILPVREEQ